MGTINKPVAKKERSIFLAAVLALIGLSRPSQAEEASVEQFFPLAVGNRWVYELQDRTDAPPVFETWEVVREAHDTFVLRISQSELPMGGFEEFFIPTGIGIKRFARETQNKADPPFFLKEPLTVGTTWDDEDGTYEITALGKTISVPAGAFTHCLEVTNRRKGGKATVVTLYAPGVGVVQRDETFPIVEGRIVLPATAGQSDPAVARVEVQPDGVDVFVVACGRAGIFRCSPTGTARWPGGKPGRLHGTIRPEPKSNRTTLGQFLTR